MKIRRKTILLCRRIPDGAIRRGLSFKAARAGLWVICGVIVAAMAGLCGAWAGPLDNPEAKTNDAPPIKEKDRLHWAFQPAARPALPAIDPADRNLAAVENPIDLFILAQLRARGLSFSPRAGRGALMRRVTYDLTGLPPTPEALAEFEADESPDAYERLIDRLLASPEYGERWGRHWLDLARYAETDGFEHDAVRPHAWRYRDFVIQAFNQDMPYDQFIRLQIAGDELLPDDPMALVATGFNLLGPDMVDSSDQVQRRLNTLNDMTDTAGQVFLGQTIGCTRCHDHKSEPFTQRDYFQLQAHFAPSVFHRSQPVPTDRDRQAIQKAVRAYESRPEVRALADIEEPAKAAVREKKLAGLAAEAQAAHRTEPGERTAEQANLALETEPLLAVAEKELIGALTESQITQRRTLQAKIKKLPRPPSMPLAITMGNMTGKWPPTHILTRGDYNQPADAVGPGFPAVLWGAGDMRGDPQDRKKTGRRTALADWLASRQNPLTARVMVNRLWMHHFGRGLVETPSDFGTRGAKPSHPQLLDWLADELAAGGWNLKAMHRLMLLSGTYQQASHAGQATAAGMAADPENRLYWRMNRIRLEGEAIRDSLLAISGRLTRRMGGPGVMPPIPLEALKGVSGWKTSSDPKDHAMRSVYLFARRNLRFPFLEAFDAPDNNLSCPMRQKSTTAPQSLALLNAREAVEAAVNTARRLELEWPGGKAPDGDTRLERAYRMILGRLPEGEERLLARRFIAQSTWEEFCRALFNVNDFVYLD